MEYNPYFHGDGVVHHKKDTSGKHHASSKMNDAVSTQAVCRCV